MNMRLQLPPPPVKNNVWLQGFNPIRGMLVVGDTLFEVQANARKRAGRWKIDRSGGDQSNWKPLHPWFQRKIGSDLSYYHRNYGISRQGEELGMISDHQIYYMSVYEYPTLIAKTGRDTYIPRHGVLSTSRNQFVVIKHPDERWKSLPAGAVDWAKTRMHGSFMKPDGEWAVLGMVDVNDYALAYEEFIVGLNSNSWVCSYDIGT